MLSSCRLKFMKYHLSLLDFNIDIELIDFGSNFVFLLSFQSCTFSSLETSWVSFIIHTSPDMGEKYIPHSGEKAWNPNELCGLRMCNLLHVKLTIGGKIYNCNCLVKGCEKWLCKILIILAAKEIVCLLFSSLFERASIAKGKSFSRNGQSQWPIRNFPF
jgi:hypothetical protein